MKPKLLCTLLPVLLSSCASAAPEDFSRPAFRQASTTDLKEPLLLQAETIDVYQAQEADQGVAADDTYFYVIDNSALAKYAQSNEERVARWRDAPRGRIEHLNSCYVEQALLWCANSNYPAAPMASSIELFETETLKHRASHSLGMMEEGSLTWFSPTEDGFIAAFAHYDRRGVPYKDHRYSSMVAFDKEWRRTGRWLFPQSVVERMAPYAASGGAIGPDGRLYVTGHDRPEMYVFEAPDRGPYLIHIATIALEIKGQAFSFAPGDDPVIFTVDRDEDLVRRIRLPRISRDGQRAEASPNG